ncbi:MAG: NADP-dependent isocitrate dehydrogenase, partial [Aquificaceae bacterium]|nr:NADP-dependent isocitrate dehydrogenase [Aquificaceae bacterium]
MSFEMVFRWQKGIKTPSVGSFISMDEQKTLKVPEQPIIGFIEGDGIGPEITEAMLIVVNRAVEKAY